jgi:hypothetical protein
VREITLMSVSMPAAAEHSRSASRFAATLQGVLDEVAPRRGSSEKEADKCLASLLDATPSLFVEPESLMTPYAVCV